MMRVRKLFQLAVLVALGTVVADLTAAVTPGNPAPAAPAAVYKNPQAALEARVEDLLARLTQKEKIALMAGGSAFATHDVQRLGIPSLNFSDGPNGVRSNAGEPTTVFPTGSALAATWNPALLESVGQAIGREALALDIQVMLGPNVNIQRSPLGGRNFESYSEDPYLAGRIGIGFVRGVQSQGVGTSVKHFVANEQEADRMRGDSMVDERTLREIYLVPFEMILQEAHPWTVMASYNRLNGTYMSENERLIHQILKGEWGFDGLLMSDWGAVHTTVEAANAGLDLEMPGPPHHYGPLLSQAVRNWQVEQTTVDDAARRMLRLILRSGALDGKRSTGELRSDRNRATALAAAREAIVLLKNNNALLPLDAAKLHTLAVIGPNADVPLYQGGGSAGVVPSRILTPLSSLRAALGPNVKVNYAKGADNDPLPPPADARLLSPTEQRGEIGLHFSHYNNAAFQGEPDRTGVETFFDKIALQFGGNGPAQVSVRWDGFFWPPRTGVYEFALSQIGTATLYIDDQKVLDDSLGTSHSPQSDFGAPVRTVSASLEAGRPHRIRIDYVSLPFPFHSMHLGIRLPSGDIQEAVQAAQDADAAIVFVGSSRSSETEGRDRPDMTLSRQQNELVEAVLAANPRTIVVLNSGSPLELPWAARASAVVEAWLAGEEGPQALADILLGKVNPSGKLPFTFPQRLEDNPAYLYYSPGREARYGEGVFVGYRYYEKRKLAPLFPFGHGLSYTRFEYTNLRVSVPPTTAAPIEVSVDIHNTGERAGQETVQLYVGDEATRDVVRPIKELRAFQKASLAPGKSTTVRFTLTSRDLSYYDVAEKKWTATPGTYRIYVGSSSADIRLEQPLQWAAARDPRTPPPEAPSLADFF